MIDGNEKKSIKEQVLQAIESGRVKMRPRWHFILQATLFLTGTILASLILLYLASFIFFTLRQTGVLFGPMFGSRGWFVFFRSLPWILILVSLIFIVILEILVRRYSFAHRKPLLYSLLGIFLIVLIGGSVIAPFHRRFFISARQNRLPFAGDFYRNFGPHRMKEVYRGTITEITPSGFFMEDLNKEKLTVVITPRTRLALIDKLDKGDTVIVFGDEMANRVMAYGIQEISE